MARGLAAAGATIVVAARDAAKAKGAIAALGHRKEAIAVWDGMLDRCTASEMPLIDEATHPLFLHLVGRRGGPFNTGGA